ncbi:uncharacterized protein LOC133706026 isoform X3 [Populus nigra]|uniref:uncharacterized protein LOC133706026 isoform X3 n=1 Tax=Populus nigra TaxID=3691 RepID=UPI002B2754D8|nr:uncharacterized protein LOC133706026 isoform X3 [Populus nigra]
MFRSKIPRMFNCKKRFLKKGAERDSLKKWIPIMEMQYRGAVYRDWCQGGLPEGIDGLQTFGRERPVEKVLLLFKVWRCLFWPFPRWVVI